MPDIQQFSITPLASANVTVPRASISAQVTTDAGAVLFDFTGANAIVFPLVIASLSAADRLDLARYVAIWLIRNKAGLTNGPA